MSETALCIAVRDQIKTEITTRDPRWIDIRPDGQPPSSIVNEVFVSVWEAGWEAGGGGAGMRGVGPGLNNGISEEYYINATVTVKVSQDHKDFWGVKLNMPWDTSLSYAVRGIINAIHLQPNVRTLANAELNLSLESPFVEMLRLMRVEPKKPQGPDWFGTTTTAQSQRVNNVVAWSRTISFFGGKRIQCIGSYT